MGNRVRAQGNSKNRQPAATRNHAPGERGSRTGTGRSKRMPVSNTLLSRKKSGRANKMHIDIPEGVTGTGEQAS